MQEKQYLGKEGERGARNAPLNYKMCLNVNKIIKKGIYKETTFKGQKGDTYKIDAWTKCGHCSECMNEKANNWVIRNIYEDKKHDKKIFITLTYEKNPLILIRKDIQNFFKRLRKYLEKADTKIRYYGCGEYGTLKGRPHYHAIIYGWIPKDIKKIGNSKRDKPIYYSETLNKIWGLGITTVQEAPSDVISYMALYQAPNLENRKKKLIKKEKLEELKDEWSKKAKEPITRNILGQYKKTKTLPKIEEEIEEILKENKKWYEIKEFNFYSQGIGQEEFIKDFENIKTDYQHYIGQENFKILTPSPWIKQMANWGEQSAIEELLKRRDFEKAREETTEEREKEKRGKEQKNHEKEVIEKLEKPIDTAFF